MKKTVRTLVFAVLLLSAVSCRHKELCYDHTHVVNLNVVFDWKYAPDADPASMAVYLYPEVPYSSEKGIRYDFTNRNGGVIRIPIGNYKALCINSDTKNIVHSSTEDFASFVATTRPGDLLSELSAYGVFSRSIRAEGTEDERVALSPETIYTDRIESFELTFSKDDHTITFYPRLASCNYTVEIREVSNLKYILGASGSLASMAGGWMPGLEKTTDECVTVPFDVRYSVEAETINAEFRTFSTVPAKPRNILTIYAVLRDESKWYYTFDVTDQILSAPDPYNVHIILNGLPFPKPLVNGGGLHPEVNPWEDVEIPIEMN